MADLVLAVRLILAAVFAVAGLAKLIDQAAVRQAAAAFGVPRPLVSPVAVALPIAELTAGAALLVNPVAIPGAITGLVLLVVFITGIAIALARGGQPDCRCFGQLHSAPAGWTTLARNAALAGAATLVVAAGPGTSVTDWSSGRSGLEWLTIAVAIVLVMAFVFEGSLLVTRWRHHKAGKSSQVDV